MTANDSFEVVIARSEATKQSRLNRCAGLLRRPGGLLAMTVAAPMTAFDSFDSRGAPQFVARMERSDIRGGRSVLQRQSPAFAALNPGYRLSRMAAPPKTKT